MIASMQRSGGFSKTHVHQDDYLDEYDVEYNDLEID